MASEDTDLTFIRCPSCKSLVPAIARRCRMCSYVFEEGEVEQDESVSESSRVRRRTVSESNDSLAVEDEKSHQGVPEPSVQKEEPFRIGKRSRDFVLEDVPEELVTPNQSNDVITAATERAKESETATEEAEVLSDAVEVEEEEVSHVASEEIGTSVTPKKKRKRKRRKKKGSKVVENVEQVASFVQEGKQINEGEEEGELDMKPPQSITKESPQVNSQPAKPKKRAAIEEGFLVGWLVKYDQEGKGEAIELRSGRFFIGHEKVRGSDLTIDDNSISTPHCLVKASIEDGLIVQDLMSESGTFVKRRGESSYDEQLEPVRVNHGDWLKLGNCELLVCIIPLQQE